MNAFRSNMERTSLFRVHRDQNWQLIVPSQRTNELGKERFCLHMGRQDEFESLAKEE